MAVHYELIEHENSFHDKHWAVKLSEGDYAGVVYQYDTVSLKEENDELVLDFNTITLDNPNEMDLTSEEFESTIGGILTDIIEKHIEELTEQEKNDENGTGDTGASA